MKSIYSVIGLLLLLLIQGCWQKPSQDAEKESRAVSKRHNEIERHAEGTYTSDISSYLEGQAVNEFIRWLMKGRGRRDFSETDIEEMDRRHADGTVTSDINSVLESIATRDFLNWLINAKSS
ncbi:pro-glucagon isoform X1 [Protopterus annectens]|uniref:pro-glucagon isoform X1 n=1 Tax=Protopterus annectens TaxID=7888 RepID=UPI001CFA3441|nr:pro-glucagon isoform X1 [Protopterus annectens]